MNASNDRVLKAEKERESGGREGRKNWEKRRGGVGGGGDEFYY